MCGVAPYARRRIQLEPGTSPSPPTRSRASPSPPAPLATAPLSPLSRRRFIRAPRFPDTPPCTSPPQPRLRSHRTLLPHPTTPMAEDPPPPPQLPPPRHPHKQLQPRGYSTDDRPAFPAAISLTRTAELMCGDVRARAGTRWTFSRRRCAGTPSRCSTRGPGRPWSPSCLRGSTPAACALGRRRAGSWCSSRPPCTSSTRCGRFLFSRVGMWRQAIVSDREAVLFLCFSCSNSG
jgi:hypothetical protein